MVSSDNPSDVTDECRECFGGIPCWTRHKADEIAAILDFENLSVPSWDNPCPSCGKGCLACFDAGKSHAPRLTKGFLDELIDEAISANEKTHPAAREFSPSVRHGMRLLRDSLLERQGEA